MTEHTNTLADRKEAVRQVNQYTDQLMKLLGQVRYYQQQNLHRDLQLMRYAVADIKKIIEQDISESEKRSQTTDTLDAYNGPFTVVPIERFETAEETLARIERMIKEHQSLLNVVYGEDREEIERLRGLRDEANRHAVTIKMSMNASYGRLTK